MRVHVVCVDVGSGGGGGGVGGEGGGEVGSVHQGDYNISRLQMEAGK